MVRLRELVSAVDWSLVELRIFPLFLSLSLLHLSQKDIFCLPQETSATVEFAKPIKSLLNYFRWD